jgi:hypothetical protein
VAVGRARDTRECAVRVLGGVLTFGFRFFIAPI